MQVACGSEAEQPAVSEIATCVGWVPVKLHVYVIVSPSVMVAGLMLKAAVHEDDGEGGGDGPLGDWCDTMTWMCACSVVGALPSRPSRTQSLNSPTGSLTDTSLE